MALNFSSLEILSSYGASPSMAVSFLPTSVNWSMYRSKMCGGIIVRSGLSSCGIAIVGEAGEKAEENDAYSIDDSESGASSKKERPGTINMECELVDLDDLMNQLRILKSINVDGIMVNCWWGIVEAHAPQQYNWSGYKRLFHIVRDLNLKLQVAMSFHAYGGNVGDDVHIPLPQWVMEVGTKNPDIFFTDREGRRNHECLSWGIDRKRVLRGRTALKVYFDYMKSFHQEFHEFFEDGLISKIEIGLGPCGELRYPSHNANNGWEYPGIGEFQCYDKYLMKSLKKAAEKIGMSNWAKPPQNAGSYNSKPQETKFFRNFSDGGEYEHFYGQFFLKWYCGVLLDHADQVLVLAENAFADTCIAAKLPVIHWTYETQSHAAELTAGIYNCNYGIGYSPIVSILRKHGTTLDLACVELPTIVELQTIDQIEDLWFKAKADPKCLLVWQVLSIVWPGSEHVARDNAFPCYDRESYNGLLKIAKPMNDPFGRHLSAFTYHRLSPELMEEDNLMEFERFVKRMHGKSIV